MHICTVLLVFFASTDYRNEMALITPVYICSPRLYSDTPKCTITFFKWSDKAKKKSLVVEGFLLFQPHTQVLLS